MSNEKCPKCGQQNCGLYLDETEGWYICSRCGSDIDTRAKPKPPAAKPRTELLTAKAS